jgi:hypothetical protein
MDTIPYLQNHYFTSFITLRLKRNTKAQKNDRFANHRASILMPFGFQSEVCDWKIGAYDGIE